MILSVVGIALVSLVGFQNPSPGYFEYSPSPTMVASGGGATLSVSSGALFTEVLTITDQDEWINMWNNVAIFDNYYTTFSPTLHSGALATTDSGGNPIVNPNVAQSQGGKNTFTYFIIARTVTTVGFWSDQFVPHDNAGSSPPTANCTNDGQGTTREIIVTVSP